MTRIKVELIDESITERKEEIGQELLNWFQDVFSIQRVKDVKDIAVKDWQTLRVTDNRSRDNQ